jgi:dTDP-4-dehydrorhamnose 3,5-epimerase-like enzyme
MKLINQCKILQFPQINDPRGALTFIENSRQIPFDIKRVYFLYDISSGATRAGHGHKKLQQVLIAISGSFDVEVGDGFNKRKITLNRPFQGLYIPETLWRSIDNFSSGSVCLSLASDLYDESDYFRKYEDFLAYRGV